MTYRRNKGISSGIAALTASTTSKVNRIRFSKLPPYWSVRLLLTGLMKLCKRYPCALWISMTSKPAVTARLAASTNAEMTCFIPSNVNSRGWGSDGSYRTAEGPQTLSGHPSCSTGTELLVLSHGAAVEAFRPAWANWIAIFWFWECTNSTISARGLMWASDQIPLSWGEIRPSGKTAVASTNVNPGPREAIPPTRL